MLALLLMLIPLAFCQQENFLYEHPVNPHLFPKDTFPIQKTWRSMSLKVRDLPPSGIVYLNKIKPIDEEFVAKAKDVETFQDAPETVPLRSLEDQHVQTVKSSEERDIDYAAYDEKKAAIEKKKISAFRDQINSEERKLYGQEKTIKKIPTRSFSDKTMEVADKDKAGEDEYEEYEEDPVTTTTQKPRKSSIELIREAANRNRNNHLELIRSRPSPASSFESSRSGEARGPTRGLSTVSLGKDSLKKTVGMKQKESKVDLRRVTLPPANRRVGRLRLANTRMDSFDPWERIFKNRMMRV